MTNSGGLGFGDLAVLCCGGFFLIGFVIFALLTGTAERLLGSLFGGTMNRPGGTFNNPNLRGGGRIGGGAGFNNPFLGGSGRIGGGQGNINPNESSSGSIGGRSRSNEQSGGSDAGQGGGTSFG